MYWPAITYSGLQSLLNQTRTIRFIPFAFLLIFTSLLPVKTQAATWADIDALQAALKEVGTDLKEAKDCEDSLLGFYEFEKDKTDAVVVCLNNIPKDDPDAYWEVVAHEATHVMQACTGDYALNDEYINTAYRELKAMNPTAVDDIDGYGSWNKRQEVEARWMLMQLPEEVIAFLRENCKESADPAPAARP